MSGSFYNTSEYEGRELREAEAKAATQEDLVLAMFRALPGRLLTPEDVSRTVLHGAPLTSARRAITNLAKRGLLEKTSARLRGAYGRPVHCWRLAEPYRDPVQLALLDSSSTPH